MVREKMFLLIPAAFIVAAPGIIQTPPAIFTAEIANLRFEINCNTNEQTVRAMQSYLAVQISSAKPLQIKRKKKELSESENLELLRAEGDIASTLLVVSSHQYAQYYCDNPELIPEEPIDPATIS